MAATRLIICCVLLVAPAAAGQSANNTTHVETEPIRTDLGPGGKIETMAMDAQGRLLLGISWSAEPARDGQPKRQPKRGGRPSFQDADPAQFADPKGKRHYALKVVDTKTRKVVATWPMKYLPPKMIHGNADGSVYVGGKGKLALFDKTGKPVKKLDLEPILGYANAYVSGMTASDKHVFLAFGKGWSLRSTEDIYRFDRDLSKPKKIISKQFGCCAHLDLEVEGDVLLIAENSRHRVNRYTFDGELLQRWGKRDRTGVEGFTACCNPVNFDFGPDGLLYTAESGVGRIKKYAGDGTFLGVVGYVDTTKFDRGSRLASMSCYIPIEVSRDGKTMYVMDVRANFIRVLSPKPLK